MENGCSTIFDEELTNVQKNEAKKSGETIERICSKSIKELAKKLFMFLELKYTSPTKDEVQSVCESAMKLFTTIGTIVSTFFPIQLMRKFNLKVNFVFVGCFV